MRRGRISNGLRVGRLHVDLEALGRRTTLGLDEAESVVDLQFELLREAVVSNTDQSATNLHDLSLSQIRCKVENVLEAIGGVSSDLNVAVHDGSLGDFDEALDTRRVTKKCHVGYFLGVAVLERLLEQRRAIAHELDAVPLNGLLDNRHEAELGLLGHFLEDCVHGRDDFLDQLCICVVHIAQDVL